LIAGLILFCGYFRLSTTYAENSDMANILLMGEDLLHGNVLLHGWHMSDVSFYPTELVQYALLESVLGLHMTTAHVAAAMTYTLAVLLVVLLARGSASGMQALVRTLIAGGIMIAPQLSAGVYAVDLAVGHIGTSVPLLLGWLLLDRAGRTAPARGNLGPPPSPPGPGRGMRFGSRGWRVPALLAILLAWVLVADPIAEIAGIAPLALVAGFRFVWRLAHRRPDPGDAALAGAALAGYALAWLAQRLLRAAGGYVVSPLPVHFRTLADLPAAAPALWRVLDLFGADFHGMRAGVPLFLAVAHLASVVLVAAALGRVCWRSGRGVPLVDQVLAVGIVLNLALYLGTLASTQGAHEIAVVLPYAAALAGRVLVRPSLAGIAGHGDVGRPAAAAPSRARGSLATTVPLVKTGPPVKAGPSIRVRTGAAAGALVLCGYLAGFAYELTFPSSPPADSALASWLLAHGFRSGLATYWQASSVTVDTGGRVAVRAVTGSLSPYLWMTNTGWYRPQRNEPDFLVLQQPSKPELALLRRRLGPPDRDYQVDGCTVLVWHRNLLAASTGLRDHNDRAAGVAGQPAGYRADQVMPEVPRRADDERVGAELGRDRGEFPRRAAPSGTHVHLKLARVGGLVELGEQPALQRVGIPQQAHHLAGQRLAVDAGRRHVDHEQRPPQPPGHPGGVGEGVA
jgi:hypothetical protein